MLPLTLPLALTIALVAALTHSLHVQAFELILDPNTHRSPDRGANPNVNPQPNSNPHPHPTPGRGLQHLVPLLSLDNSHTGP